MLLIVFLRKDNLKLSKEGKSQLRRYAAGSFLYYWIDTYNTGSFFRSASTRPYLRYIKSSNITIQAHPIVVPIATA